MPARILSKNATPSIFPHLNQNAHHYNETITVRESVESLLKEHDYYIGNGKKYSKRENNDLQVEFDMKFSEEVEVESISHEQHELFLENKKLKSLLEERIKQIEVLEKQNHDLEEEKKNGLLPKDLFKKIFGDDQLEHLQKGRIRKWSTETIKKALKLRFAAGTRGL